MFVPSQWQRKAKSTDTDHYRNYHHHHHQPEGCGYVAWRGAIHTQVQGAGCKRPHPNVSLTLSNLCGGNGAQRHLLCSVCKSSCQAMPLSPLETVVPDTDSITLLPYCCRPACMPSYFLLSFLIACQRASASPLRHVMPHLRASL